MKRRVINRFVTLLCMVMLVSMLGMPAQAALCKHDYVDTVCTKCGKIGGTCGTNVTWAFIPETGLLRISGEGVIPNYDNNTRAPWYPYRHEIKKVELGVSIAQIGSMAFYECTELTTINIPKNMSNIYTTAFSKCYSLEEFDLAEESNYVLDEKGVLYNKKMTYLIAVPGVFEGVCEIPDTVINIGPSNESNPFRHISGVTEIRVAEGNTKYSSDADGLLYNKDKTTLIVCPRAYEGSCTIPATVTSYNAEAFTDCYGLTGIFVEEGNTKYSSTASGLLCDATGKTVKLCPAGFTGVCEIPAEITSCPVAAFPQSIGLTKFLVAEDSETYSSDEVGMLYNKARTKLCICPNAFVGSYELPVGVTTIAPDAFMYCPNMTGFEVGEDNTKYSVDEYGVLFNKKKTTLISCPSTFEGTYVVPDTVTTLNGYAFYNCSGLKEITLPDTVTTIGGYCFYKCTNLSNVPLPPALKTIGAYAFAYCTNQTDADVPETVTTVGSHAFAYCPSITSASIPEGVTNLTGTFRACENLSSISIPDSVTTIGSYCFYKCTNLPDVSFPPALTTVGSYAFAHCPNQTSADLPETVTTVGSYAFAYCSEIVTATIPEGITTLSATFRECTKLESVSLPNTMEILDSYTFYGCENLSQLNVPDTVTKIGTQCFRGCENLPNIPLPSNLTYLGGEAFHKCLNQRDGMIPETVTTIGDSVFAYCENLEEASIPDGFTVVPPGLFQQCPNLKTVSVPDSVTEIGRMAFTNCSSLVSANIPDGVTAIGESAFYKCNKLENIRIPSGLEELGTRAFSYCNKLTDAVIPETLTQINDYSFHECENLENVTIHDGITRIGKYAFYECKKMKQFPLPASLEEIGSYAFYFCSQFEELIIPESVKKIGGSAFRYCQNLKKVVVPGTVEELGDYLFYAEMYSNLTDVTLGEGLSEITNYMFYGCNKLENIQIPETVSRIGVCAFRYCESLPEIAIPDQVTEIAMYAFEDCIGLKGVKLPSNLTSLGEASFRNTGLTELEIPDGVQKIELLSFANCTDLTRVVLPASVKTISDAAFMNTAATDVIYYGTEEQWNQIAVGVENSALQNALMHYDPDASNIHEIVFDEREASCESNGGTYHSCSCGAQKVLNPVPAIGHSYSNEVTRDPTCAQAGIRSYTCANDPAHNYTEELEKLSHTEVAVDAVAATCTEAGTTAGVRCSECNEILSGCERIDALEHQYTEQITKEATCTEAGSRVYTCANDSNHNYSVEIPATGHKEVRHAAVEATCTAPGKTEGISCETCGAQIVAQTEIPEPGHKWTGVGCAEVRVCSVCEKTEAASGHVYDNGLDGICNVCSIHREETGERIVVHMFRMYNPNTGEHFYTGSEVERDDLIAVGWQYEGIGFTFPANTGLPVYRLFQPSTGEHLYTMDEAEKDRLMDDGWNYEGIAFNSAYDTEAVQHRLHNPNATVGAYHFTFSLEEKENLIAAGWEYQGIGWYSCWK